ncbi:MAG: DUF1315 family protein [Morganella sp. (in: enterobacteria)]|uniref:Transcriptional regulator n=1 Tax=Morganella psychrotolerans TaxID=368603 RepID=A0A1B8HTY5_9GAMM|nr:DUF1315 family protein [Morganella psychrotolerans]OBU13231.1 transcriptional regulator [Morganella psychrotolerans]
MEIDDLLSAMTPEVYRRLVTAVELGKWADGVPLTESQKSSSLQLVMIWQSRHNEDPEHMSIGMNGEISLKSKQALKALFNDTHLATIRPQD